MPGSSRPTRWLSLLVVLGLLATASSGQAQTAFIPGNLAVFQANAVTSNTAASILELSKTTVNTTPVQTIAIPDSATATNGLRFSGSATSTGYLSRTSDGTLLTFNGVNTTNTTANINTLNPRGVGTLSAAGSYNLATTYTGTSGQQTRAATSLDNTNYYIADQAGIYTNGSTAASPTGNFRNARAFGGTVYVGTSSTAFAAPVGTLNSPSGSTFTALSGLPATTTAFQDFYLVQSGNNGSTYDVLYTLSTTTATAGTIAKYSLVNGSFVANGTATTNFGGFGLAAELSGTGASLYITSGTGATSANSVIGLTDTAGYNSTISLGTSQTTLFTAATGTTLKGIDFVPVPEPGTVLLAASAGLFLVARRRLVRTK